MPIFNLFISLLLLFIANSDICFNNFIYLICIILSCVFALAAGISYAKDITSIKALIKNNNYSTDDKNNNL